VKGIPIVSRRAIRCWATLTLAVVSIAAALPATAQNVSTYHGPADRSGNFVMPALSWERARDIRPDTAFDARFSGHLYAQPLYWKPPGAAPGQLIVASESNTVAAIDSTTGKTVWTRSLGPPVPLSAFPCGNIDPLGITGTPVIDENGGALFLDAMVDDAGPHHRLFALSLEDGSVLPGWPIDVADALRRLGQAFDPRTQNQRGALAILDGALYAPYGGFFGDCGTYYGWVVGVRIGDPHRVSFWRTRGRGGGIWAPGGIVSDGQSLYVATGNTEGATEWADGEAVFRLAPDLQPPQSANGFFAAEDWRALDQRDADLGGTNPLPFRVGTGPQRLLLALGKDERAYLLDPLHLGGIGGALLSERVANYPIRTAPAAFPTSEGMLAAFQGRGVQCPAGQRGDLTVLKITGGTAPALNTAWCGAMSGGGAPIVTTTDGRANPIVWILGAEGDNRLHAFRGDTGEALFASAPLEGLRHFQTLIAADTRLYIGADDRIYVFALP
jgi:hypothetical protein